MYNYNNDPFAKGTQKYQQEIVAKALNDHLIKCVKNSYWCAHCSLNHGGICFFAKECFENDRKYYREEDEE